MADTIIIVQQIFTCSHSYIYIPYSLSLKSLGYGFLFPEWQPFSSNRAVAFNHSGLFRSVQSVQKTRWVFE